MYAVLRLEVAVCHIAFDIESHGLNTRLVSLLEVGDADFVVMFLAIALVEAHELFRPVLCLCTTSAGYDLEHGRHLVFLVGEHILHLEVLYLFHGVCIGGIHLVLGDEFLFVVVEGELQFFGSGTHTFVSLDPFLDAPDFAHLCFGSFGILPESWVLGAEFFLL